MQQIDLEAQRTAEAKARFEARQQRLEREKQAREAKHAAAKRRVSASESNEISAAIARVKAKSADDIFSIFFFSAILFKFVFKSFIELDIT